MVTEKDDDQHRHQPIFGPHAITRTNERQQGLPRAKTGTGLAEDQQRQHQPLPPPSALFDSAKPIAVAAPKPCKDQAQQALRSRSPTRFCAIKTRLAQAACKSPEWRGRMKCGAPVSGDRRLPQGQRKQQPQAKIIPPPHAAQAQMRHRTAFGLADRVRGRRIAAGAGIARGRPELPSLAATARTI